MISKKIEASQYDAVLVPEGLEDSVRSVFPDIKIYVAPIRKGTLTLSSFTLATAISLKGGAQTLSDVEMPDYAFALQNFILQNPKILSFGTHITRFSTSECLKNPFKKFTQNEHLKIQNESQYRLMKLMFGGKTKAASYQFASLRDMTNNLSEVGTGRITFATFFKSKSTDFSREVTYQIQQDKIKLGIK
jgi:hypothetical protein